MKHALVGLVLCQAVALSFAQGHSYRDQRDAPQAQAHYQCGGVGDAEQARFKKEASEHDALVTFATPTGAYLADVDVVVTGPKGDIVTRGHCDGPLMLLDVPHHGRYRIQADYHGKQRTKTLNIGTRTARTSFVWEAS